MVSYQTPARNLTNKGRLNISHVNKNTRMYNGKTASNYTPVLKGSTSTVRRINDFLAGASSYQLEKAVGVKGVKKPSMASAIFGTSSKKRSASNMARPK